MSELEQAIELLRAGRFHVSAFGETDSRGAAFLLGWTVAYLANRRSAGAPLPSGFRFGTRWFYRVDAVLEFRRVRKTAEGETSSRVT